jgi:hypothetical protein
MPAELVPNEAIPDLAARVNSPEMLRVLRRIQQTGSILNGSAVDQDTAAILKQLADLGLVDPGYAGPPTGPPYLWVSNGNGARVLSYLTGIRAGPHYEIPSSELAAWLEQQGEDRWWNVDGDPLLTGRMAFPCPADELAAELRKINRPLLIQAKKDDAGARGQVITKEKLHDLVDHFGENLPAFGAGQMPLWSGDRLLYLCWKGSPHEWLLVEDSETTERSKEDEAAKAK